MIAAFLGRKSNDEGDASADVKSVTLQRALAQEYAGKRGWTLDGRYVFVDDGISGAEYRNRPGLQALLAAVRVPVPPFQRLIVTEQSRIGRDTVRTLAVIQEIEEAGVEIWACNDGRQITLNDDAGEITTMLGSWRDKSERTKTIQRVRNAAFKRHEAGYVAGGTVFGYRNERLPGAGKQPVRRVIEEQQAAVVKRIFEMTRDGLGLAKIAKRLNAEAVPGPRSQWSPTGVREILHRELYRGVEIFGRVRRERRRGAKVRVRVPESEWKRRDVPDLRLVDGVLWDTAHARIAEAAGAYLRRNGRLLGQVESIRGKYLLSGFLACGVCRAPLIAMQRGRNLRPTYVCRAHKEKGNAVCLNTTAVPMERLHRAVIRSLRDTLSPENFEAHLAKTAADEDARASRAAEREALIARIPVLNAEAERLANAVAAGSGALDVLLTAIKQRQAEREQAELRLAELEGIERDLRADAEAVERLRATWKDWEGALDADPVLARQLLRKVLAGPIAVSPRERGHWTYAGISRFDGLLHGAVGKDETVVVHRGLRPALRWAVPIAGGSDAPVGDTVRDREMAPHTPDARRAPAKPWRVSVDSLRRSRRKFEATRGN
jgi:site-specific DNA recombinase